MQNGPFCNIIILNTHDCEFNCNAPRGFGQKNPRIQFIKVYSVEYE